jgi:hypothetical protein
MAVAIATVAWLQIAVIALFGKVENTIATILDELALGSRRGTGVPSFDLTGAGTAIGWRCVAIVASLATFYDAVSTRRRGRRFDAKLPCRWTRVTIFDEARGAAAITGSLVVVVASLAAANFAIAAFDVQDAFLPYDGARVVGVDSAHARAAIAGQRIAVVARLAFLQDGVAAHWPGLTTSPVAFSGVFLNPAATAVSEHITLTTGVRDIVLST